MIGSIQAIDVGAEGYALLAVICTRTALGLAVGVGAKFGTLAVEPLHGNWVWSSTRGCSRVGDSGQIVLKIATTIEANCT